MAKLRRPVLLPGSGCAGAQRRPAQGSCLLAGLGGDTGTWSTFVDTFFFFHDE